MALAVAIVGCGKIADAHVEQIRRIPSVRLVAVCDLEPIMAEQLAGRYGITRWYSDVSEMLRLEEPNVVHITTPPGSHLSLARQAVAAGCHVFVEKPVAPCFKDVEAIVASVIDGGRTLGVNYWPRFEAVALQLEQLYQAGVLGTPVHLESHLGYDLGGDFGLALKRDPEHWVNRLPGKLFHNVLDHVLNKLTPFLGEEQPVVHATACSGLSDDEPATGAALLDELRVVIRGRKTTAYATFSAHARPIGHTLRVYGTKNTATVDFTARTIVLDKKPPFPSAVGRLFPPFLASRDYFREGIRNLSRFAHARYHYFDGMHNLLNAFYSGIQDASAPPIAYSEILSVSRIMDCIFAQVYPEAQP